MLGPGELRRVLYLVHLLERGAERERGRMKLARSERTDGAEAAPRRLPLPLLALSVRLCPLPLDAGRDSGERLDE
jgi:hypothetical protein